MLCRGQQSLPLLLFLLTPIGQEAGDVATGAGIAAGYDLPPQAQTVALALLIALTQIGLIRIQDMLLARVPCPLGAGGQAQVARDGLRVEPERVGNRLPAQSLGSQRMDGLVAVTNL